MKFAERMINIVYINQGKKEYGDQSVKEIYINGQEYKFNGQPVIHRNVITSLDENIKHIIKVVLK